MTSALAPLDPRGSRRARRRRRERRRRVAGRLAASVVVLVAGVAFWPARFGGPTTLVVVQGTSMEPTLHRGDLLYARTDEDPEVGDIAVYRMPAGSPGEGKMVVHRVLDRTTGQRFVMQGDNRDMPDGVEPAPSDLVGRATFNLGPWPTRLLLVAPVLAALVLAACVGCYLWPETSGETAGASAVVGV